MATPSQTPRPASKTANTTSASPTKHHYFRTLISAFFGFIAISLVVTSILVVWLNRTLTNTDQYVKTVAPLVTNPDVQNFIVQKASTALLDNQDSPINDIAAQLLPDSQLTGQTVDQLKAQVTPIIQKNLHTVISSPAFVTLWTSSNRTIHAELMRQLNNDSPTISLNFHPVIVGAISQLSNTNLGFIQGRVQIKPEIGLVTIKGKQLANIHKAYGDFQKATLAIVAATLVSIVLCVLLSTHHSKTARRIAILTGIFATVLLLSLSAVSLVKVGGTDPLQQKMAVAMVEGITKQLRLSLIVIAGICFAGAIGSKVYSTKMSKKAVAK